MIELKDKSRGYEELNLPFDTSIDTPKYREAYADLMRTSKHSRQSGLTYVGFLSRMKKRNIDRRKKEFMQRRFTINEKNAPMTCEAFKQLAKGH